MHPYIYAKREKVRNNLGTKMMLGTGNCLKKINLLMQSFYKYSLCNHTVPSTGPDAGDFKDTSDSTSWSSQSRRHLRVTFMDQTEKKNWFKSPGHVNGLLTGAIKRTVSC